VLFICGPHANQFLDPLLLFSEVRKEAGRRVSVLTAAKVGVCEIVARLLASSR
jgi:glycerol-3-phosphate O-acyltransferase/dihydroxyacetone phosphate acyltransferase